MANARKHWCFTLNNYTQQDVKNLKQYIKSQDVTYGILGFERGESGTEHIQGYIQFAKRRRFNNVREALSDRAHIEAARGSGIDNRKYCSKSGDYYEAGLCPKTATVDKSKGQYRRAVEAFIEVMQDGHSLHEFMLAHPTVFMIHGSKMVANYYSTIPPEPRPTTEVVYVFGPTGTGKSHTIHTALKNYRVFYKDPITRWFDGYACEKIVVIDDFLYDHKLEPDYLRWFDKYPYRVQIKGGYMPLSATLFIVTTNVDINTLAPTLRRRMTHTYRIDNIDDTCDLQRMLLANYVGEAANNHNKPAVSVCSSPSTSSTT